MLRINVKDCSIALRHLLMLQNAELHVTDSPIVSGIPSALSAVNVQIHRPTAHQAPALSVGHPSNPAPTAWAWWNPIFCKYIDLKIHFKQTHFLMFDTRFEFRVYFQGNTRRKSYNPREEMGKFSIGKTTERKQKVRQCLSTYEGYLQHTVWVLSTGKCWSWVRHGDLCHFLTTATEYNEQRSLYVQHIKEIRQRYSFWTKPYSVCTTNLKSVVISLTSYIWRLTGNWNAIRV